VKQLNEVALVRRTQEDTVILLLNHCCIDVAKQVTCWAVSQSTLMRQEVISVNGTQAQEERLTVTLIPQVAEHLRLLEQRTSLSRTDLANRAITLYEFVDAQLRDGQDLAACDKETGKVKFVRLLGPSEGSSAGHSAGPPARQALPAGRPRRSPARWLSRFPALAGQSDRTVRAA
jgi:hypothetical protein